MTISANTALLLIDIQQGLDDACWGARNNPDAERHIAALLAAWRHKKRPGDPRAAHVANAELAAAARSARKRVQARGRPQARGAGLPEDREQRLHRDGARGHLRDHRIDTVVVVGLTTDHCVSTTTRMAANLGFTAIVVSDATATFERTGPDGDAPQRRADAPVRAGEPPWRVRDRPADRRGVGGIGGSARPDNLETVSPVSPIGVCPWERPSSGPC